MNLQNPVSSIMTPRVYTLTKESKLQAAKDLFDTYPIHHIPVLERKELVGIVSKADYLYFIQHIDKESFEKYLNEVRLKNYTIGEVMSNNVVTIAPNDTIQEALEILSNNLFHALPVVENGDLVGILTTHDVIFRLLHPNKVVDFMQKD